MKHKRESRREFLTKGLSNRNKIISDLASFMKEDDEPGDKVKMLTPDGKLVEVDRRLIENNKTSIKARHEDILNWIKKDSKK